MSKHEFALFYSDLSRTLEKNKTFLKIEDKDIIHRVNRILRLKPEDQIVLFGREIHIHAKISSINKQELNVTVKLIKKNKALSPKITMQLGLLKRDALEAAVEALTVFGVNDIQLFMSDKVSHKWGGKKELERLERIMIAAAEQSKQFVLPQLHEPIAFAQMIKTKSKQAVFCDPEGDSFLHIFCSQIICEQKKMPSMTILVGPEGDLTNQEKELLQKNGYKLCRLTETVLRSELAATLAAGILRSI